MRFAADRFHLVGIGGAGQSGLARLLHGLGARVSGSDRAASAVTDALIREGMRVWIGHAPDRIEGRSGYVVRSAAVPRDDPEVLECERRGYTELLYAEAVGRLTEGRRTLALSGTHGKTTTTALTICALRAAGLDPSHLVGGEVAVLGGNGHGGQDEQFVVEACEFNRSFLQLHPDAAAVLNLDHDHVDCFPTPADVEAAYAEFLARVRPGGSVLLHESVPDRVLAGLRPDVEVLTVGTGLFADLRPVDLAHDEGRFSFVPVILGESLPRVQLSLTGQFQVVNALFALGLARACGADVGAACSGVGEFGGVGRRFEVHVGPRGGLLVDDYAHHPAEIRAVLRAARRRFHGSRLLVAFQPHQHQRTLALLPQFAESLTEADECLVLDIYGAREAAEIVASVSAQSVVEAVDEIGGRARAAGGVATVAERVAELYRPGDVVMVLGAGDIGLKVEEIRERL